MGASSTVSGIGGVLKNTQCEFDAAVRDHSQRTYQVRRFQQCGPQIFI